MSEVTRPRAVISRTRIRFGLFVTFVGTVLYLIGAAPELFRMNRSPVTGFVQIATFLVGLGLICIGGYISLNALWNGFQRSIGADIGLRLVSTGYVVAVASGMADMFGIGNDPFPKIPYFGAWQAFGVLVGEAIIAVGFLLIIPHTSKLFK